MDFSSCALVPMVKINNRTSVEEFRMCAARYTIAWENPMKQNLRKMAKFSGKMKRNLQSVSAVGNIWERKKSIKFMRRHQSSLYLHRVCFSLFLQKSCLF